MGGPSAERRRFRRWVAELRRRHPEAPPEAVAAAVTVAVAAALDLPAPAGARRPEAVEPPELPEPAWADPRLPGLVYEALADADQRRHRGAWFTPRAVVDALVDLALDPPSGPVGRPRSVLDPACGGGAFLLGVADGLHRRGVPADDVAARLVGVDLDPGAVGVTRDALDLWAAGHGVRPGGGRVVVGDGLHLALDPVDLVVGNPPFASPLRSASAGGPAERYRRERPHLGPYADAAACFADRAAALVAPGGRLALVLPQSLLVGRDGAGLRAQFDQGWELRALWVTAQPVFDAAVHVFAPVLERTGEAAGGASGPDAGRSGRSVAVHAGPEVSARVEVPAGTSWAEAAAAGMGIPDPGPWATEGTLGSLASATSGFRDQHYGLAAACREASEGVEGVGGAAPLVTVGQIDPLHWRRAGPVRFARRRWDAPVVDPGRLAPPLAAWVARQQRPKVLLATQTRVLEPLIDRGGALVPATPVIAVHAAAEDLDRVAAVLLAPPVVAWAARRSVGAALHPDTVKLAARQVLEVPLPADRGSWDEAAALLAHVDADRPAGPEVLWAVATAMCRAYRVEVDELRRWWWERLPRRAEVPPAVAGPPGRVAP